MPISASARSNAITASKRKTVSVPIALDRSWWLPISGGLTVSCQEPLGSGDCWTESDGMAQPPRFRFECFQDGRVVWCCKLLSHIFLIVFFQVLLPGNDVTL